MRLVDYLDKGASVDPGAPCLTTDGTSTSYAEVRELSFRIAAALVRVGVAPGDKVAILSANDPVAFTCVFGISRAGAVWCPINPRNEAAENRELLDLFDCTVLIHQQSFAPLVDQIRGELPKLTTIVSLDGEPLEGALSWEDFLGVGRRRPDRRACRGRPRDDRRHRRHHRAAQGRDAHRDQPGDDDRHHPDELSVLGDGRSTSHSRR